MCVKYLIQMGTILAISGAVTPALAQPQSQPFDTAAWLNLSSQTCLQQAPRTAAVQALNLSAGQLKYSCNCLAKDLLGVLPVNERTQLLQEMRARKNMQQTGERLMNNPQVKKVALACSAASWWN
jgi:hypothetical protein